MVDRLKILYMHNLSLLITKQLGKSEINTVSKALSGQKCVWKKLTHLYKMSKFCFNWICLVNMMLFISKLMLVTGDSMDICWSDE